MSTQQNRSKEPFILIQTALFRDERFYKNLSLKAQSLWILLRTCYNPFNEDCTNLATGKPQVKLSYSYIVKREGFKSYQTISKAFEELIEKGWIQKSEKGTFGANAYTFLGKYAPFKNHKPKKRSKKH